ncbi:MAG: endonuclease/exonuclease/phosphatase family protein [Paracoccaceae bacterium]
MATLTIGNWNVEWMNRWFAPDRAAPVWKRATAGVTDLQGLAARVAGVIEGMGADIVTLQEGPSRFDEMALFVRDHLGDAWAIAGPAGKGQQKLYALIAKGSGVVADHLLIEARDGFDFADPYDADVDGDLRLEPYTLTRPPLVLDLTLSEGRTIELISVHAKSKYVHNGATLWRDPDTRQDFVEMAIKARRRIASEALRLRQYLNRRFEADPDARIVVTGDFNDGPGLDYFETNYLAQNVAGLIAGSPYHPQVMLRHAFVDVVNKEDNFTAEFYDFVEEEERRLLLDHVFVSPALFWNAEGARAVTGAVLHDLWRRFSDTSLPGERERRPSDHRPQVAVIDL